MTGLSGRYDDDDLLTDLQVRRSIGSRGSEGQVGQRVRTWTWIWFASLQFMKTCLWIWGKFKGPSVLVYKHPVSINSHFGLFNFLTYCHISLHISDNLSPNLTSRDILRKKRTRAFIWHQSWWDFRLYCWRYGLLKSVQIYLTDPVYSKLALSTLVD